ncbi:Glycosyltransferase involved in cell wall bisynthesis [Noviherbaspirillum humi]|uniref:Glycosyltransferase involved in cell wall bisynthesis n=1 Tax=Noviherbaspirillum humi TaxID=1688639 RepID=A0A239GZI8_9BURK|nr:glycosyltransferase family 4 protein [Noviherbaspirillum humi]SNS74198.1 Glycosyltransferase involved in cell wall bisynthesis [Noviherbaspirillum humi]
MLRVALVSNELPPYRIPFFEALGKVSGIVFQAILCSQREPNRHWELPRLGFDHVFLKERVTERNGRYIHNNPDVIAALRRFRPGVIVTGGFNPTHLYAFAYAAMKGVPHVPWTDGTLVSEQRLHKLHRSIRKFVYQRSAAFIASSDSGIRLFESYGIAEDRCYKSCLCVDNGHFAPPPGVKKQYDFLFCGRIEPVKNPLFALEVALKTARQLGRRVSMLVVGTGAQEEELRRAAAACSDQVKVDYQGFTAHENLPSIYHSARIFMLPSLWEPWGVVVNEACASGVPVIVSPHAGANELVDQGRNGYIEALDASAWARRCTQLLSNSDEWQSFSQAALRRVSEYSYANSAKGFIDACHAARGALGRADIAPVRPPAGSQPVTERE